MERYREVVDPRNAVCPVAEEACTRTILLRHQALLGGDKDMDDIIQAFWKILDNLDELDELKEV
jgi:hypothetical protein